MTVKKCTKGYPCGETCIARSSVCRQKMSEDAQGILSGLKASMAATKAEAAAAAERSAATKTALSKFSYTQLADTMDPTEANMSMLMQHMLDSAPAHKAAMPSTSRVADKQQRQMADKESKRFLQLTNGAGAIQQITQEAARAFARQSESRVDLGAFAAAGNVWHEMAHHLEFARPDILADCIKFRDERATGPAEKLSKLTGEKEYADSEVAVPDKFISRYVGKVYAAGNSTEVLSMGFEHFATSAGMTQLYKADKQHFMLIVNVIQKLHDKA